MTPKKLRELIKTTGCRTQSEAAKRIGVARTTLVRWLGGARIDEANCLLIREKLKPEKKAVKST